MKRFKKNKKKEQKDKIKRVSIGYDISANGDFSTIWESDEKTIKQKSKSDFDWGIIGAMALQEGEVSRALYCFDKSLDINPQNVVTLATVGDILSNLGRYEESYYYLNKALSIEPDNITSLTNMGALNRKMGNYEKAIKYYSKAIEIKPDDPVAYNYLGVLYLHLGDYLTSKDYFQKSIDLNLGKSDPLAYIQLAICQIELKDEESALRNISMANSIHPRLLHGLETTTKQYIADGKPKDAFMYLKILNLYKPNDPYYSNELRKISKKIEHSREK